MDTVTLLRPEIFCPLPTDTLKTERFDDFTNIAVVRAVFAKIPLPIPVTDAGIVTDDNPPE